MSGFGQTARGALLIAGTSIGGGMLALPVLTSQAGFLPSLLLYLACWLFMVCTGLLFLEISLWMQRDANIVSMSERTLGVGGKIAAWLLYLFLFYSLTLAYIVGSGELIVELLSQAVTLTSWQGQLFFLVLFAPFIYAGARWIGFLNVPLMIGLGLSYLFFVILGVTHVDTVLLARRDWSQLGMALPITFTAFAYQGIIPTLVTYLDRDVRQVRLAILVGSFLPFIAYVIWQWLILGIVPAEGPNSLAEALEKGQNAVHPLKNILNVSGVYVAGQFFAFFALVTSFFGVTLGLFDFLADGFKIKKDLPGKLLLCVMIFVPPLLFAVVHPHVFLIALDHAGGLGCALLLGLLPVLMVWSGRYYLGLRGDYQVGGGRVLLVLLAAFVVLELICEFFF
jgi:tyrosine-specific transport protein